MDRRSFLKWTGLASVMVLAPGGVALAGRGGRFDRTLVLVELKGGNDGLNTLVPYADKAYYRARPSLAIGRNKVAQLSGKVGLAPPLEPLMKAWKARDMAVLQGVGYPKPNRSHFRSIEIWETGSRSDQVLGEGWMSRLLDDHVPKDHAAAGVILGDESAGPFEGGARALVMRDPQQFIKAARRIVPARGKASNPALAHVLSVQDDLIRGADVLEEKLRRVGNLGNFPRGKFGKQLQTAARLIVAGVPTAAIKVTLGGFDTHAGQTGPHQRLLGELGGGMAAFRQAMIKAGLWDKVLVVTYSEFGRRVAENGSGGTDHGTAAPHFALGGRVKGGLYGKQPSLTDLSGGDLKHHLDFRDLYATLARDWWSLNPSEAGISNRFKGLGFLR